MIKSYDVNNEAIALLKQAIDIFANGEMIHDTLSRSAHMKGLQGFKRWHRIQSKDDRKMRVGVQHYVIDMFGYNLEPSWEEFEDVKEPISLKEHLETYLDWEISVYKRINALANDLVVKGYNHEAEVISECISGVVKEIEKIRRWLDTFNQVNYDMSYIFLIDRQIHDKCKVKEM